MLLMLFLAFAATSCEDEDPIVEVVEAETFVDVPYANTSSAQLMDIHIPEGAGPFPTVIYVHGGGFFTGDKSAGSTYVDKLVENGYVAVSMNYRLSGEAIFPAAVQDCKAAVRFFKG